MDTCDTTMCCGKKISKQQNFGTAVPRKCIGGPPIPRLASKSAASRRGSRMHFQQRRKPLFGIGKNFLNSLVGNCCKYCEAFWLTFKFFCSVESNAPIIG